MSFQKTSVISVCIQKPVSKSTTFAVNLEGNMEAANPETERKMEVIQLAHFACSEVFEFFYMMDDALYEAQEEFLKFPVNFDADDQECEKREKMFQEATEGQRETMQGFFKYLELLKEHKAFFEYHLVSFNNVFREMAQSVDPNHGLDI